MPGQEGSQNGRALVRWLEIQCQHQIWSCSWILVLMLHGWQSMKWKRARQFPPKQQPYWRGSNSRIVSENSQGAIRGSCTIAIGKSGRERSPTTQWAYKLMGHVDTRESYFECLLNSSAVLTVRILVFLMPFFCLKIEPTIHFTNQWSLD